MWFLILEIRYLQIAMLWNIKGKIWMKWTIRRNRRVWSFFLKKHAKFNNVIGLSNEWKRLPIERLRLFMSWIGLPKTWLVLPNLQICFPNDWIRLPISWRRQLITWRMQFKTWKRLIILRRMRFKKRRGLPISWRFKLILWRIRLILWRALIISMLQIFWLNSLFKMMLWWFWLKWRFFSATKTQGHKKY